MINLQELRKSPEEFIKGFTRRGVSQSEIEKILVIDQSVRQTSQQAQELKAKINRISKEIANSQKAGNQQKVEKLKEESKELGIQYDLISKELKKLQENLDNELKLLPNLPAPECPDGLSEKDNKVIYSYRPPNLENYESHQRVPHFEIGKELGIIDLERGAKISGSMFIVYRKAGAKLIRALTNWALDKHEELFEEIKPPTVVKSETMVSTGHLPKFSDEAYHIERDDLWAIPTAEVPLTSLYKNEVLDYKQLPMLMTAATACFRREAGAYGKDTRGLLRVHEFEKVEILAYCTPEQSSGIHQLLLDRAQSLLKELNLEHRVVDLCAGDLGNSSRRTFDLETYAPGVDQWLEVSSVSWFGDYQARRANLKFKDSTGKLNFLHTLNGSALAWPRIMVSLLEVGRQPDGTILLPDTLAYYLKGRTKIDKEGNLVAPR